LLVEAGAEVKAQSAPVLGLMDRLRIEAPMVHDNLVIYPIAWDGEPDGTAYATLSSSTRDQTLSVTELETASVPELKLINKNRRPLFLMTGEVLTGAKQDRILAHDILIDPSRKEINIPVYCVESGRWTEESREFSPAKNMATPNVRSKAQSKSSQGEIWNEVAVVNDALNFDGGGSLQQGFEDEKSQKERAPYLETFTALPDGKTRVGAVVVINGAIVTADVFSSPQLLADLWPKLLESYALEAYRGRDDRGKSKIGTKDAQEFVGKIFEAGYRELTNPGAGAEYLIEASEASGSALVADGRVLHLGLFPESKTAREERRSMNDDSDRSLNNPPPMNAPANLENQDQRVQIQMPSPGGSRAEAFKSGGIEFRVSNPKQHKVRSGF
jgi:hypothetical protein